MRFLVYAVLRAASRGHRSEEVVQIAAEILEPDLLESGSFVTLIYGRLHIPTNTIQYLDAGHGLTIHITKSGALTRLETTNYPIGLGMHKPWETKTLSMDSGDTLMLLSDGMLAIFNESIEDLLHIVVDVARSGESAKKVIESLKYIADNSTAQDDVTALVIRRI
jgi:serine phosphatase RsbU (regulator of sigma subunit)